MSNLILSRRLGEGVRIGRMIVTLDGVTVDDLRRLYRFTVEEPDGEAYWEYSKVIAHGQTLRVGEVSINAVRYDDREGLRMSIQAPRSVKILRLELCDED